MSTGPQFAFAKYGDCDDPQAGLWPNKSAALPSKEAALSRFRPILAGNDTYPDHHLIIELRHEV
jgi:hypothetical protein